MKIGGVAAPPETSAESISIIIEPQCTDCMAFRTEVKYLIIKGDSFIQVIVMTKPFSPNLKVDAKIPQTGAAVDRVESWGAN